MNTTYSLVCQGVRVDSRISHGFGSFSGVPGSVEVRTIAPCGLISTRVTVSPSSRAVSSATLRSRVRNVALPRMPIDISVERCLEVRKLFVCGEVTPAADRPGCDDERRASGHLIAPWRL